MAAKAKAKSKAKAKAKAWPEVTFRNPEHQGPLPETFEQKLTLPASQDKADDPEIIADLFGDYKEDDVISSSAPVGENQPSAECPLGARVVPSGDYQRPVRTLSLLLARHIPVFGSEVSTP